VDRFNRVTFAGFVPNIVVLCGCQDLTPKDRPSLIDPHMERSEVLGLVAGFGTTFAALPDLIAMLKRRSTAGMNPRMAAIMGLFRYSGSSTAY
jgi:MtN3 and saliva related transmembrane protein